MNIFDSLDKDVFSFDVRFKNRDDVYIKALYRYEGFNLDDEIIEKRHFFDGEVQLYGTDYSLGEISFEVRPDCTIFLDNISVLDGARRKGYGSLLIEFMEKVARDKGVNKIEGIYTKNPYNKEFYNKNGYEIYAKSGERYFVGKTLNKKYENENVVFDNIQKVEKIDLNFVNMQETKQGIDL